MNLLDYNEIWRVLLIGAFAGTTILIGFYLSYIGNRDYIRFLQSFIDRLELLLEDINGRPDHSDISES